MEQLSIGMLQMDIIWADIASNLKQVEQRLLSCTNIPEIIILPEMFATGFQIGDLSLAETMQGSIITTLQVWANQYATSFIGSFLCKDGEVYHNRAFFISCDQLHIYNKRHLFRMSDEFNKLEAGVKQEIFTYKGWNISLQVCYDLRFPIWSRNRNNEYDLLIYVASWPEPRQKVWETLLQARAIENMAYVIGVNRVGNDGLGLHYLGGSQAIDMKGDILLRCEDKEESLSVVVLDKMQLSRFREKFPVWKDADRFQIEE